MEWGANRKPPASNVEAEGEDETKRLKNEIRPADTIV